jgi:hypothetical protein
VTEDECEDLAYVMNEHIEYMRAMATMYGQAAS